MLLIINQCLKIHILAFLVYHRLQNWVIFAAAFLLRIAIKSGRLHLKQKNCDRLTAAVIFQEKTPWSFNVRMDSFDSIPDLEGNSSNQPFFMELLWRSSNNTCPKPSPFGSPTSSVLQALYWDGTLLSESSGPSWGLLRGSWPPLDMEESTHRGHKSFLRGQIKI